MFSTVHQQSQHLRLLSQHTFDSTEVATKFTTWLQQIPALSQVRCEQGLDVIEIRFWFQSESFYGHYEHYSESFWIDTDSVGALMLLSELAKTLEKHIEQTIESI